MLGKLKKDCFSDILCKNMEKQTNKLSIELDIKGYFFKRNEVVLEKDWIWSELSDFAYQFKEKYK